MIEIEQKKFAGNVKWLENGTEILILDPADPVYVGDPSPDIDRAWDSLVEGRYFSISREEARRIWGDAHEVYRDETSGGYTGG